MCYGSSAANFYVKRFSIARVAFNYNAPKLHYINTLYDEALIGQIYT